MLIFPSLTILNFQFFSYKSIFYWHIASILRKHRIPLRVLEHVNLILLVTQKCETDNWAYRIFCTFSLALPVIFQFDESSPAIFLLCQLNVMAVVSLFHTIRYSLPFLFLTSLKPPKFLRSLKVIPIAISSYHN